MFHSRLIVVSTLSTAIVIAASGCNDRAPTAQSGAESPRGPALPEQTRRTANAREESYVTCRATLKDVNNAYRYFERGPDGSDDGVAPLASFVLVEPSAHAERALGILFKYASNGGPTSPVDATDVGRQFSVEVPNAFLRGNSSTIDNLTVRKLRRIEP